MRGSELQILRNYDFHRLIRVINSESLKIINRMVLVTDYLSIINLNHFQQFPYCFNSQAAKLYRGPCARCARSGENGEGGVRSL